VGEWQEGDYALAVTLLTRCGAMLMDHDIVIRRHLGP
jgi:hypothetical protein